MITANEAALSLLKNYSEDLHYISGCGRDSLNHFSSGTPYFDTDEEMREYCEHVDAIIQKLEKGDD